MLGVILNPFIRDVFVGVPGFSWLYECVNIPAMALVWIWFSLRLPPHGDQGFVLYLLAVAFQWFAIFLLVVAIELYRWFLKRRRDAVLRDR